MTTENDKIEELKLEILKCEPRKLLELVSIICSLPQNREKIPRFETLFKLIVSLPDEKFQKNTTDETQIRTIFLKLDQIYLWNMIEDYNPTSVLDYPPLWILGERYRIFPGPNDRAYEYWKDLVRYYFDIRESFVEKFHYDPIIIIQQILALETDLVKIIEKNHSHCRLVDDIYFPTTELISEWEEIFNKWKQCNTSEFYKKYNITFGELRDFELIEIEPVDSIYKFFSIKDSSFVFPHTFHGFLSSAFTNDHDKIKTELEPQIAKNLKYHLKKKLTLFFRKDEMVPEFSLNGTPQCDLAVFFDNNKLFVFKIINLDFINDINSSCKNVFGNIKNLEKSIQEGKTEFFYKDQKIGKLPHNNMEIIPIILFHTTKVNTSFQFPNDPYIQSKLGWFGFFMDFLSMLDEFDDFMRFLKFLRREKDFLNRIEILSFSNLDLVARYLQNYDSFLISGKLPHMMTFVPGLWDKFKIEQIKKRPDFQPHYEETEEDDYWELKVINDSLFHVQNKIFGYASNIFLLPSLRPIWILAMNEEVSYSENEIHCISSLTELIPHRFINNDILDKMLEQISIGKNIIINFSLMSTKMVQHRNVELLKPFLPEISDEHPIIVKSFVAPSGHVLFYVLYSPEQFLDLLEKSPLEGEKYVITQLLTEICNYAQVENIQEIVSKTIDDLFKDAKAAFSFTHIPLQIFTPNSITDYQSTLESDKSEITRTVAEFLTTLGVSPGIYKKNDAKEILNKTYEFLNQEFITRISKIEQIPLLTFLVHSDGQINKDRLFHQKRTRHEYELQMEHDPLERFSKKNEEIKTLSGVYRYSIEIAIKHWSDGSVQFTLEDWLELQAMTEQILKCSFLSSYLYFGLGEYILQIFDDYSFNVESKNVTALESFSTNFDKLFVISQKPTVNFHTKESSNQFIDELDEPFKEEFNITFRKLGNLIDICLFYLKEKKLEMHIISIKELFEFGSKLYPEMSIDEMRYGLEVLSLSSENLTSEFYPSDVRNRQYRYGCRPIIKFPDKEHYLFNSWSLDNVNHRMFSELDQGYLLYNDNYICSNKLLAHLQTLRDKANKAHEKEIYILFKTKTSFVELNIKEDNQLLNKITEVLPGEIDVLAIFTNSKEVWLIEAKNIKMSYAARDMSNEIKAFVKSDGYIDKFNKKIEFIKKHLSEILDYYKISDKQGWKLRNYFVTSNVSFPQEASTEYTFITLTELRKIISDY